ncbi:putative spermatogenesis-associated protein 22 isoform 3 [Scophthalmus maximus]|uniref:Putative spermatogenesis-associated protein 22 isoform 3 n=1 Tax=Scophthalmus maximus TaxID=52904 RepID=A0A2U9B8W6_SCOMX|nr:putative spermatogenesis-associated protein 22 isoform 3 [Scophthalmus maximus]
MRRQENQPPGPTAGCLPVPLFHQKKRSRIPLTSAPSVNEFFSHSEYVASSSSATPHGRTAAGTIGSYQASGSSSGASQSGPWNRQCVPQSTQLQQLDSNRPAPGPAPKMRAYAPMPHPYKAGSTSSQTGQPSYPARRQDSSCSVTSNKYPAPSSSEGVQNRPTPHTGFSHMGQQLSHRQPNPTPQHPQQRRPLPPPVPPLSESPARVVQPQNNTWKFTNSFGPQSSTFDGKRSPKQTQTARPNQTKEALPMKPVFENSLRILTAVIHGMRHWSQFKDKVPYLFEIFATLDSAVTLGRHGAKTFLMRDGKEVLQCVFYENVRPKKVILSRRKIRRMP